MGRLFLGTSGFSYDEWDGRFYPAGLRAKARLTFYAERFNSVEINSTYYRFPSDETLGRWRGDTPSGFVFALKATAKITHRLRLIGAGRETADLFDRVAGLEERLGPVLFQLPPYLKRDGRLADFLGTLPEKRPRVAFEFRHPSWLVGETYHELAAARAGLCLAEGPDLPGGRGLVPVEAELAGRAGFAYLRLRGLEYSEADLLHWAGVVGGLLPAVDVHVYFKHEEEARGPEYALRLAGLLSSGIRAPAPRQA